MVVVDCVYVGKMVNKRVAERFPDSTDGGFKLGWYAASRTLQMRKLRVPSHRSSAAKRSDRPCEHWSWAASGRGSLHAESLLAGLGTVRYVATGPIAVDDDEWAARGRAPSAPGRGVRDRWDDRCCGGAARAPRRRGTGRRPGNWVAALVDWEGPADDTAFDEALAQLCAALREHRADIVVVSPGGPSGCPETSAGRRFQDLMGRVNQAVAEAVDETVLLVAGRVVALTDSPTPRVQTVAATGASVFPTDTAAPVDEAVAAAVVTPRPPSHHR